MKLGCIISLLFIFSCSSFNNESITPDAFERILREGRDYMLLDVRTPEEYAKGYIEGAVNLDYRNGKLLESFNHLDKEKQYLIYCQSGKRSAMAAKEMTVAGFKKVLDLNGGIIHWQQTGRAVTKK